ncbi:tRNA (adenine-N(1)-)-methyltransferase catalytic subunit trm61 [Stygiomarasmius scandens]|uniref:tRNA (adenine(58)-N(1))-methyltransferase catalytic subunit TRM61 n=1 Tax=Marasmiellus scandens TaxID=2682957 RepID=A0ABR1JJS9_9AGAR
MWSTKSSIAPGDTVILWLTREAIQPLLIEPGKEFNSKFGSYRHSDLVGVPYGSKVPSRTGKGFIHVLRPTPELWTLALPHRTQILYLADIAFVTAYLGITSGSVVVEAGTGSASFSHSTLRTIGPHGHLFSYEFHQSRATKAKAEFANHGFDGRVTLEHRNVCKDGFGDVVSNRADAVFLDLPAPWDAVEHAKIALRKDRQTRICCFSPCMEQVLRTVTALNDAGFTDITTYETLLRPYDISSVPSLPTISEARNKLLDIEVRKEEKRVLQVKSGHRGNLGKQGTGKEKGEETEGGVGVGEKRKRETRDVVNEEAVVEGDAEAEAEAGDSNSDVGGGKRVKIGDETVVAASMVEEMEVVEASTSASVSTSRPHIFSSTPNIPGSTDPESSQQSEPKILSRVMPEVRGHTSYLTFACLLPSVVETPSMKANGQKVEKSDSSGEATQVGQGNVVEGVEINEEGVGSQTEEIDGTVVVERAPES